jgi:hypothetical protein
MMTIRDLRVWSEYSITLRIVPLTPNLSLREREEVSFQPFLNKGIPGQNQDNRGSRCAFKELLSPFGDKAFEIVIQNSNRTIMGLKTCI